MVSVSRVNKFDAQMETLLHHIQPSMKRSIAEVDERIDRMMSHYTERNIIEVNKCLNAFELRVLARPTPIVDLTTLQAVVVALLSSIFVPPPPQQDCSKRHQVRDEVDYRAQNKSAVIVRPRGEPG